MGGCYGFHYFSMLAPSVCHQTNLDDICLALILPEVRQNILYRVQYGINEERVQQSLPGIDGLRSVEAS